MTNDSQFVDQTELDGKQDTLVNQQNIKSINAQSILGPGNLALGTLKLAGEGIINPQDESLNSSMINKNTALYITDNNTIALVVFRCTLFNIAKPPTPNIHFIITLPTGYRVKSATPVYLSASGTIMDRSNSFPIYGGATVDYDNYDNDNYQTTGATLTVSWRAPLGYQSLIQSTNINSSISGFLFFTPL